MAALLVTMPLLLPPSLLLVAASGLLSTASLFAEDWPGFRGPTGMGVSSERGLPLRWGGSNDESVLWKAPLPPTGKGVDPDHNQSSPVVAEGKVVVTTAHWPAGVDKGQRQPEHHVACYEAATGKQLWDTIVAPGPWVLSDLRGGYAAPTPAIAGGRVFAVFGSSILHGLDLDGKLLWSYVIADHDKFDVALPSSPLVYKDTVILQLDKKTPASTIVALDAASGKVRWEQKRPECDFNHMTPVLATVNGKVQMIVSATHALEGLDPEDGNLIWSCQWGQAIWPVSSPVMAQGLVYAVGGRGGHPGVVVDPGGEGDVTGTHLKWKIGPASEGLSSPIAFGEFVYRFNSPGVLRCVRIADGEELFKERLPGADSAVSPFVTADGRLYFASAGKSVVIEAAPTFKILGESDLGDPSLAAAAVSDGRIFLKGREFLWAIGATR